MTIDEVLTALDRKSTHWLRLRRAKLPVLPVSSGQNSPHPLHAAWTIDNVGPADARDNISLIKFHTANTMMRVLDRAIQTYGGLGVSDYTPLALFYRTERAGRIYDGADEVHKISVAKRILRRYQEAADA